MITIASRALALYSAGAPGKTVTLFVLILAVAVLEMLSIGLIIPVIHILFVEQQSGPLSDLFARFVPKTSSVSSSVVVVVLFCAVFVAKNFAILGLTYVINWSVKRKAAEAQAKLFRIYLNKPFVFHLQTNSSEILRNVMSGCTQSFEASRQVFMIGLEIILSIAAIVLLMLVEPVMTLIVGAFLIPGSLVFYLATAARFRIWGQKSMEIEAHEIRWINQALSSIRFAKIFGAVDKLTLNLFSLARDRAVYDTLAATALQVPRLFLETLIILAMVACVGIMLVLGKPPSELTTMLGVFAMAALRLLPSFNRTLAGAAELRRRSPYIDTVYDDLIADRENPLNTSGQTEPAARTASPGFSDRITIDGITLSYPGASHPALDDVGLTIRNGEAIGIVGPSGAGKTSLVDAVIGLLSPDAGTITVDRRDIATGMEDWQRLIGYVPQETYLLDDTLRRNIAFSIGDEAIDEERIASAIQMAKLGDVVASLPDGLDTLLGESGARLSGGQRQRIAIARALYRDPEVLVFDEATAALDNESEREISAAIRSLSGQKTIFLIAHRLSTVRDCDKIVFMKDARIVDTGTFQELYDRCDGFRKLVDLGEAVHEETAPEPV